MSLDIEQKRKIIKDFYSSLSEENQLKALKSPIILKLEKESLDDSISKKRLVSKTGIRIKSNVSNCLNFFNISDSKSASFPVLKFGQYLNTLYNNSAYIPLFLKINEAFNIYDVYDLTGNNIFYYGKDLKIPFVSMEVRFLKNMSMRDSIEKFEEIVSDIIEYSV